MKRAAKEAERLAEQAKRNTESVKDDSVDKAAKEAERLAEQAKRRAALADEERRRLEDEAKKEAAGKMERERIRKMTFTVRGNIGQLRKIKEFLDSIGVDYE